MTSTAQHISYVSTKGIMHSFRRVSIKELYKGVPGVRERIAKNVFMFPLPSYTLPERIEAQLHRLYTLLEVDLDRADQYLCNFALAHDMPELRTLFESIISSTNCGWSSLTGAMRHNPYNATKKYTLMYSLSYELRMAWIRAILTGESYQILVPSLFGDSAYVPEYV